MVATHAVLVADRPAVLDDDRLAAVFSASQRPWVSSGRGDWRKT